MIAPMAAALLGQTALAEEESILTDDVNVIGSVSSWGASRKEQIIDLNFHTNYGQAENSFCSSAGSGEFLIDFGE